MRHFSGILLFLFLCVPAFSQSRGIIQCEPGSAAPIPAFSAPGKPHVVEQLKCGQTVRVLGVDKSTSPLEYSMGPQKYVIIQIADKAAYVDAKYVKLSESNEPLNSNIADTAPPANMENRKAEEEQKQWSLIAKESVKLRDERLLQPIVLNGQAYMRTFRAIASNNSDLPVSQLQILVQIYDCSSGKKGALSDCLIIGEANLKAAVSIPAHQTRRVEAVATFETIPSANSKIAWNYKILGVRAE